MTRKEYCLNECPQIFNSECWTDCDADREERENEAWQDNDDYEEWGKEDDDEDE
jgi:hypothetical protein